MPVGATRRSISPLGGYPEAHFVWDRLHNALDDAIDDPKPVVPVTGYRRFLNRTALG